MKVFEIGEDSDRWLIVDTEDVSAARLAVIGQLREQLLPTDAVAFAETVETVMTVESNAIPYSIFIHPQTELVFYQSPVGRGVHGDYQRLGRSGIALGFRLPSHKEIVSTYSTDPMSHTE